MFIYFIFLVLYGHEAPQSLPQSDQGAEPLVLHHVGPLSLIRPFVWRHNILRYGARLEKLCSREIYGLAVCSSANRLIKTRMICAYYDGKQAQKPPSCKSFHRVRRNTDEVGPRSLRKAHLFTRAVNSSFLRWRNVSPFQGYEIDSRNGPLGKVWARKRHHMFSLQNLTHKTISFTDLGINSFFFNIIFFFKKKSLFRIKSFYYMQYLSNYSKLFEYVLYDL